MPQESTNKMELKFYKSTKWRPLKRKEITRASGQSLPKCP